MNALAFLAGVAVMYWSVPLGCLLYCIKWLHFGGPRDDMFQWARLVSRCFGVTLLRVGTPELFRTASPVMYLANHRCWADFFLDVFATEGRAAMLSRWAVFPVFPVFLASAMLLKGVIFFRRDRVPDKTAFNAFLDACIARSPVSGLMIYPEGHRSTAPASLPLRRGMLAYAHSRRMPIQVVITKDKEKVLSEKRLRAAFGARLKIGYSPVLQSSDFPDFESFMAAVQAAWDETWWRVYEGGATDCVPLDPRGVAGAVYPLHMKVAQALYSIVAIALLLAAVWLCVRLATATAASRAVAAGLVSLVALAVHRAKVTAPRASAPVACVRAL